MAHAIRPKPLSALLTIHTRYEKKTHDSSGVWYPYAHLCWPRPYGGSYSLDQFPRSKCIMGENINNNILTLCISHYYNHFS